MKTLLTLLLTINLGFSQESETGEASHYSVKTNGGTHTASGEKLRDDSLTAAHKTLPFGTVVKVTNISNGKSVQVRINDRGPHIKRRIVDLSQAAASKLGFLKNGITKVRVDVVKRGDGKTHFKN